MLGLKYVRPSEILLLRSYFLVWVAEMYFISQSYTKLHKATQVHWFQVWSNQATLTNPTAQEFMFENYFSWKAL
jgi:hypothetical protein